MHVAEGHSELLLLQDFEELFGIRYLPYLEFSDYRIEKWIKKKCQKAREKGRLADYVSWLGHLHKRELEQGVLADCSIRWIDDRIGYGLFAEERLQPAAFVGEYTGILRPRNQPFANVNDYCFMYPRSSWSLRPLTIDSERAGNHTRFINHSDRPNLEALSVWFEDCFHIFFRTTERVLPGTELTYDYGKLYWRHRKNVREKIS